jgi:hypothetical protein
MSGLVLCIILHFHDDHDDTDDGHNPKPEYGDVIHFFTSLQSWSTADSICKVRQKLNRKKKNEELKNREKKDRNN